MAEKHYYSYQGRSGHRSGGNSDSLFGWTVFIFLLIGFVFFCWMGSYYIFAHPEKASNYRLLLRLHKIDPPQRFEITEAPRGEFLKPGQLLERFGSMTASEIRRTNENLLRNFLRNYHQNRELVPYAVGTYRVVGTLPLTDHSFCRPGLIALLQAVEQPEIILEQPFTCDGANLPALTRSLAPAQEIKLEKPLDLSAIIHVERLEGNRLLLTTMPLLYGSYGSARGGTSFSLEPPEEINLDAGLPLLSQEQIGQLSGGKLGKTGKAGLGLRLSRIAEEEATPTPEPRVAKALPANSSLAKPAVPAAEPVVARAIPVNAPPVLPAIPVSTPNTPPVATAIPVATPVPALPSNTPAPTPVLASTPKPALSPLPQAAPVGKATAPAALASPSPMVPVTTNQPTGAPATEVWPVYAPGQMPRGRLVEPSESQDLAARGIGGERHYLKGRFSVTAAGNGRAVLRPQGTIAGVPTGPNSKVRVIVEYPAGAIPPSEGSAIARDNLRPFQIISVKRGDDGQINIYAREVTRGQ
jgi:hypothetical protein